VAGRPMEAAISSPGRTLRNTGRRRATTSMARPPERRGRGGAIPRGSRSANHVNYQYHAVGRPSGGRELPGSSGREGYPDRTVWQPRDQRRDVLLDGPAGAQIASDAARQRAAVSSPQIYGGPGAGFYLGLERISDLRIFEADVCSDPEMTARHQPVPSSERARGASAWPNSRATASSTRRVAADASNYLVRLGGRPRGLSKPSTGPASTEPTRRIPWTPRGCLLSAGRIPVKELPPWPFNGTQ